MADMHESTEGRISRLETEVHGLGREMRQGFEDLKKKTTVQWGPLISAVAVLLTVGGMFGSNLTVRLNRIESSLDRAAIEIDDRGKWLGATDARIDRIESEQSRRTGNVGDVPELRAVLDHVVEELERRRPSVDSIDVLTEKLLTHRAELTRLAQLIEVEREARMVATQDRFDSNDFLKFNTELQKELRRILELIHTPETP